MRITDYEAGRVINDVAITLTRAEAEELAAYLRRLIHGPEVQRAHLSEIQDNRLEKELTIALTEATDRAVIDETN